MGFKLLVCLVIGLGALYLLYKLAQDYMIIRQPAAKLARLFLEKRDLHPFNPHPPLENMVEKFDIDSQIWSRIINNDPLGCAQLLICQVVAGAEGENEDAIIIHALLEYAMTVGTPKEIETAYNHGRKAKNSDEMCYKHYSYCPYSARTMLKLLQYHSYLFG